MKNYNKIIWGIIVLAIGIVLVLNALDITDISLFFDGWWTLFIIVPCFTGIIKNPRRSGNYIGLAIGIYLLLCCLDILRFSYLWRLFIPVFVVILGLKLLFGGINNGKFNEKYKKIKNNEKNPPSVFAAFSANDESFDNTEFKGAELTAVFGGIKYDLSHAIITDDCAISFSAVFGGIDIIVPPGVNVKVSSFSLFGGVSNKIPHTNASPTIYVSGLCLFGGVDIK